VLDLPTPRHARRPADCRPLAPGQPRLTNRTLKAGPGSCRRRGERTLLRLFTPFVQKNCQARLGQHTSRQQRSGTYASGSRQTPAPSLLSSQRVGLTAKSGGLCAVRVSVTQRPRYLPANGLVDARCIVSLNVELAELNANLTCEGRWCPGSSLPSKAAKRAWLLGASLRRTQGG
jgi:hypothetical protein